MASVRPLIKYNSGDGAWIIAQKADQRRRFKAIICALKSIDKDNQNFIKNNIDTKLESNSKFSKELILEHCKTVDPDKIAVINVSFHDLESSEDEFYEFSSVYKIDASKNRLNLDDFITFISLVELNLSSNDLKNININPQDFEHLQILDVSFNNLTNEDILMLGLLRKLKILNLTGNNLRILPIDMTQPYMGEDGKSYTRFNKLEELNIEHNQLHSINSFSALGGLPKLRILKLAHNDFDSIPLLKCIKLANQTENNYRKSYEFEIDDEEEMEDYPNSFFLNKNMEIRIPSTLHEVEEETTNRTTIDTKTSDEEEQSKVSDGSRIINEIINEIINGIIDMINFHEVIDENDDVENSDNIVINQIIEIADISNSNELNEIIKKDIDESVHEVDNVINLNNQNNEETDNIENETFVVNEETDNIGNEEGDKFNENVNEIINENLMNINEDSGFLQANEEKETNEYVEEYIENKSANEVETVINSNNQNNEETDCVINEKSDNFDEEINENVNTNEYSNYLQSFEEKEIQSAKPNGINFNKLDIDKTENYDKEEPIDSVNDIEINNTEEIEKSSEYDENKNETKIKDQILEIETQSEIEIDKDVKNFEDKTIEFSSNLPNENIIGNSIKIIIDKQHSKISDEITDFVDENENNDECVEEYLPEIDINEENHLYLLEQHNIKNSELNNNSPDIEPLQQYNGKKWLVENQEKENICHSLIIVKDFLNLSSISDIIRQISASSFGENLPKPFPVLEFMDLSFNKVKSERALIPIIAWLNLKKLSIHNNPISLRKSQKSSFIKALLENTFKISVEWLPPISKEKPNPTIKKSKLKLSDTISTVPINCRKTNIFPALSVKNDEVDERNLNLPKLVPLPNIVNQSSLVKKQETENNMVLEIKRSLEEMDNENDNNQSIEFFGKNKSLLLRALRHRVEHPITYFERNVNLFERQSSLKQTKKTKDKMNFEMKKVEKRSELISTVIGNQKNRSVQSEISLDKVLSKDYINGNRKKKHESEIALKALRNMQKKYNQVRLESLKKES